MNNDWKKFRILGASNMSKEKAKEIAVKWKAKGLPYNAIYDSCLEMSQWKDENPTITAELFRQCIYMLNDCILYLL